MTDPTIYAEPPNPALPKSDFMLDLEHARLGHYDRARVLELLRELEFRSLIPRLPPVDEDFASPATPQAGETAYTCVMREEHLDAVISRIRDTGKFAFNIEAAGPNPYHAHVIGFSIAVASGEAFYVPVGHQVEDGSQGESGIDLRARPGPFAPFAEVRQEAGAGQVRRAPAQGGPGPTGHW